MLPVAVGDLKNGIKYDPAVLSFVVTLTVALLPEKLVQPKVDDDGLYVNGPITISMYNLLAFALLFN